MTLDDIRIVHLIPGRVRLRSRQLRALPEAGPAIEQALAAVPGVQSVEVNALTGSILIRYEPGRLGSEEGLRRLEGVLDAWLPGLDRSQVLLWLRRTAG